MSVELNWAKFRSVTGNDFRNGHRWASLPGETDSGRMEKAKVYKWEIKGLDGPDANKVFRGSVCVNQWENFSACNGAQLTTLSDRPCLHAFVGGALLRDPYSPLAHRAL